MKSLLMFIGGLVVGAGVTYIYQKGRYEDMIKEEVDDLRAHMKGTQGHGPCDEVTVDKEVKTKLSSEYSESRVSEEEAMEVGEDECDYMEEENKRQEEYEELIEENSYVNKDRISEQWKLPKVLLPLEFGNVPGFDTDTFYYYSDDIIANDMNEILDTEQLMDILGMTTGQIFDQFGIHEDDSVYVRNSNLKCDYEILRDEDIYTRRNGD